MAPVREQITCPKCKETYDKDEVYIKPRTDCLCCVCGCLFMPLCLCWCFCKKPVEHCAKCRKAMHGTWWC